MRAKPKDDKARENLRRQVKDWAARIKVQPARVQIQSMRTKWASCSAGGRICFSTDLMREPAAFREMVVVHELLHLRVPNHGRLFRSLMRAYLPRWEDEAGGKIGPCGPGRPRPSPVAGGEKRG